MLPNAKFPDIKGMVEEIHAAGLKAGVYTSPGPWTCGRYVGAYQHETADAKRFAQWGFDFLKYDWCSYSSVAGGKDLAHLEEAVPAHRGRVEEAGSRHRAESLPIRHGRGLEMGRRGGPVLADHRRPGPGARRSLPGFYSIGFRNAQHWEYAAPGSWNDPDYLLLG